MTNNFNDTLLDRIKLSLESGERQVAMNKKGDKMKSYTVLWSNTDGVNHPERFFPNMSKCASVRKLSENSAWEMWVYTFKEGAIGTRNIKRALDNLNFCIRYWEGEGYGGGRS